MQYYWLKDNRYYKLTLQKNLFGNIDVLCCWGRIGTKIGGSQVTACSTQQAVENVVNKICNRRRTRRYIDIL